MEENETQSNETVELNGYDKFKLFCIKFRIILGVVALVLGFYFVGEGQTYNTLFLLGVVPITAGLLRFCPLCLITKKCTI